MSKNTLDRQTKLSISYFTKTDTLKIVGAAILIASLASLVFRLGLVGYILAIIGTPTGVVLFILGSTSKASDADMDSDMETKLTGILIDIDNDRHYRLKLLKNQKDITIEGYRYTDGVMIKKLKDGGLRTSEFTRTKLRILSDRLYIVSRDISLIADEIQNHLYEISYDDIQKIEIFREEKRVVFNNNTFFTKPCHLVISTSDSQISFPIIDAVTSDDIVTNIQRQMKAYADSKT